MKLLSNTLSLLKPRKRQIRGSLWPSNAYAINETTASHVRKAVNAHNLQKLIKKERWDFGIIDINNVSFASRDSSDIYDFLDSLKNMVNDEQVADLQLQGDIMITVETVGVEPILYLIQVRDRELTMQRGKIEWDNPRVIKGFN